MSARGGGRKAWIVLLAVAIGAWVALGASVALLGILFLLPRDPVLVGHPSLDVRTSVQDDGVLFLVASNTTFCDPSTQRFETALVAAGKLLLDDAAACDVESFTRCVHSPDHDEGAWSKAWTNLRATSGAGRGADVTLSVFEDVLNSDGVRHTARHVSLGDTTEILRDNLLVVDLRSGSTSITTRDVASLAELLESEDWEPIVQSLVDELVK